MFPSFQNFSLEVNQLEDFCRSHKPNLPMVRILSLSLYFLNLVLNFISDSVLSLVLLIWLTDISSIGLNAEF